MNTDNNQEMEIAEETRRAVLKMLRKERKQMKKQEKQLERQKEEERKQLELKLGPTDNRVKIISREFASKLIDSHKTPTNTCEFPQLTPDDFPSLDQNVYKPKNVTNVNYSTFENGVTTKQCAPSSVDKNVSTETNVPVPEPMNSSGDKNYNVQGDPNDIDMSALAELDFIFTEVVPKRPKKKRGCRGAGSRERRKRRPYKINKIPHDQVSDNCNANGITPSESNELNPPGYSELNQFGSTEVNQYGFTELIHLRSKGLNPLASKEITASEDKVLNLTEAKEFNLHESVKLNGFEAKELNLSHFKELNLSQPRRLNPVRPKIKINLIKTAEVNTPGPDAFHLAQPTELNVSGPNAFNLVQPTEFNIPGPNSFNLPQPTEISLSGPNVFNLPQPTELNVSGPNVFNLPQPTELNVSGPNVFNLPQPTEFNIPGPNVFNLPQPTELNVSGPNVFNLPQPTEFNIPGPNVFNLPQPTELNVSGPNVFNLPQPTEFNIPGPNVFNLAQPTELNIPPPNACNLFQPKELNIPVPSNFNSSQPKELNIRKPIKFNLSQRKELNILGPSKFNSSQPKELNIPGPTKFYSSQPKELNISGPSKFNSPLPNEIRLSEPNVQVTKKTKRVNFGPVTVNILDIIQKSKSQLKREERETPGRNNVRLRAEKLRQREKKREERIEGNKLDASQPDRQRGKHREFAKEKKPSKFKQLIQRDAAAAEEEEAELEESEVEDAEVETYKGKPKYSEFHLNYSNNVITQELDSAVTAFLTNIVQFQENLFARDPIKGDTRRRYFVGFKVVRKYLLLKKIKILIVSPDIKAKRKGDTLDNMINNIVSLAAASEIPYVFALSRRKLGQITLKNVPICCVAVADCDGTEKEFEKVLELIQVTRAEYQKTKPLDAQEEQTKEIIDDFLSFV